MKEYAYYYIVIGMYIALDLVLGGIMLIHPAHTKDRKRHVPALQIAGITLLLDTISVSMHAIKHIYNLNNSFLDYIFPASDLIITTMFVLAGFSLLSTKYPSAKTITISCICITAIYLSFLFTNSMLIFGVLTIIWLAVLFTLAVIRVRRFNKSLFFHYSNVEKHRSTWFIYILVWAFAIYPIYKIASMNFGRADTLYCFYALMSMAMYVVVSYNLITQTSDTTTTFAELSEYGEAETAAEADPTEEKQEMADMYFTPDQQRQMTERLNRLMLDEKLYHDPELCVDDLVKQMGTNTSYFYYFMRDVMKSSFFDYVNRYRIDEAKSLLLKGEKVDLLAEAVGYNSANTFRRTFKRFTGLTPSEWRQANGDKSEV